MIADHQVKAGFEPDPASIPGDKFDLINRAHRFVNQSRHLPPHEAGKFRRNYVRYVHLRQFLATVTQEALTLGVDKHEVTAEIESVENLPGSRSLATVEKLNVGQIDHRNSLKRSRYRLTATVRSCLSSTFTRRYYCKQTRVQKA